MKIIMANKKHRRQAQKLLDLTNAEASRTGQDFFNNKITNKVCLVALEKDKVIGTLVYIRDWSHFANFVSDIAVFKQHRRKGIARLLFQKFVQMSKREQPKNQAYAFSSTVISNKISQKMHRNLGFKFAGIFKNLHFGKDEVMFAFKLR